MALLALFCCALFLLRPLPRIEIRTADTVCLWPGGSIGLKWRHSVEKQDWQEIWRREGRLLRLDAVYVQTFGAGVPADGVPAPAPEGYVGMAAERVQPQIEWVVSRNMRGVLFSDGLEWPVYRHLPDYTAVNIAVSLQPAVRQFFKKECV
ncbi:DUF1850 domain-containing protein [Neisseria leonii]|uniref:DUF1850 domain-containing protein n=1 Tax=Neisseria leonii TaxID=2995413 RepID=UPI0030CDEB90